MLLPRLSSVILLVAGIVIGITLSSLLKGCDDPTLPAAPAETVKSALIKKQAAADESHYQQKIDSLQKATTAMQKDLLSAKRVLDKVKKKNTILQTQVYALLDKPTVYTDTVARLADCDSLKGKVDELITTACEKDSLQEVVTSGLQQQLTVKDSLIGMQEQAYQSLKTSFLQSLHEQEQLAGENKVFRKQLRREKTRKKLVSVGLLILAGFTVHQLMRH